MNAIESWIKDRKTIQNSAIFLLGSAFIGPGISYGDFYLFHLAILVFLVVIASNASFFINHYGKHYSNPLLFFPVIFVLFSLLSLSWSDAPMEGMKKTIMISFSLPIFLASLVVFKEDQAKKLFKILGVIFAFHLFLGTLEVLTPLRWPISALSELSHLFLRPPFFDLAIQDLSRPTTFYWNPNNCALVTLLGYPFLLFSKNIKLNTALIPLAAFGVFASGSRAVILLFVSFNIFICLLKISQFFLSKRYTTGQKLLSSTIGIVAFGALVLVALNNKTIQKRVAGSFALIKKVHIKIVEGPNRPLNPTDKYKKPFNPKIEVDNSVDKRVLFTKEALREFTTSPIFGIGSGALSSRTFDHFHGKYNLASIHNFWIEVLAEMGLIFFSLFVLWLFLIFKHLAKKHESSLFFACLLLLPGILVLSSGFYFLPAWLLLSASATKNL